MESLGGRSWLRRNNQRALNRLRDILESSDGGHAQRRGRRVTVAGG
jgi:hypothetical protein